MFIEAILLTVITASTPLLLAGSGELVVERAGVLNLGFDVMMIVGAACIWLAHTHLIGPIPIGALSVISLLFYLLACDRFRLVSAPKAAHAH